MNSTKRLYWLRKRSVEFLYESPIFRSVLRFFQQVRLHRHYQYVRKEYGNEDSPDPSKTRALYLARSSPAVRRLCQENGKPRILFLGNNKQQDETGMLQALQAHGEVTVYFRRDGQYGIYFGWEEIVAGKENCARIREYLEQARKKGKPYNIIIGQMLTGVIDPYELAKIREEYGVLVVLICMDARQAFLGRRVAGVRVNTSGLARALDYILTTCPEAVGWYFQLGLPATFFPEASDANIFRPMPELGKTMDVVFIGARYGNRRALIKRLHSEGFRVEAWGRGWPNGRIDTELVPSVFATSKIVLGSGFISASEKLTTLKLRDFDGPMSGSLYLTTQNPDLERVYCIGEEIETYSDINDCIQKCRTLLRDDERLERIARLGRERAVRDHQWRDRIELALRLLKGEAV